MDFRWTDEQQQLKRAARDFMEKEIIPNADEWDKMKPLSKELVVDLMGKLSPLGYVTGMIPRELGGDDLDYMTDGLLMEELWRAFPSFALVIMIQSHMTLGIANEGTDYHKEKFLAPMLTGEMIASAGITEPNVGSNPRWMETTAVADGDNFVINGTKIWISNGSISDMCMLVVSLDRAKGKKSIARILVDRNDSPYERRDLRKLGLRSSPTGELVFDDCVVPKANLFTPEGAGLKETLKGFELARCHLAIGSTGIAQAAIDATMKYVMERKQFGKLIGNFQLVQSALADMLADTEASRLLAYRGLSLVQEGVKCAWETSLAKFYATEAAVRVTSRALQLHGAYGLSEEFPLERYFRDARSMTIPDGTTDIQKLIIGRELTGLNAFI
jgi:alkylation response protein AidB-like acyl-CoA dehydrogenase